MKKRASDNMWIPFWIDKWIFGSMRIEHTLEERAIWIDLLALAAKDDGYIRANENTSYPIQQLAGMLIIPEDKLSSAIENFIKTKKLTKIENGILHVTTWEKYQLSDSYERVKRYRKKQKTLQCNGKGVTREENIRENNIKEKDKVFFPNWIPKEEFNEYKKMRMKIRKPMTDKAIELSIRKLDQLRKEGYNPKQILEQSILNSWQGLFPLRKDSSFGIRVGEHPKSDKSPKQIEYEKLREAKLFEIEEKYHQELNEAKKAQDIKRIESIRFAIKMELSQWSQINYPVPKEEEKHG